MKISKTVTIILLQIAFHSFGQSVRIDTLLLPRIEKSTSNSNPFKFPEIRTGNQNIDKKINAQLKRDCFSDGNGGLKPESEWVDESLFYIDFEVTFNKKGVLSLNISMESCGAYCTNWTNYYNYSALTGEQLSINDIIDFSDNFKHRIINDKDLQFLKQKEELEVMRHDTHSGLDEESFKWALENYQNCQESFEINEFALYNDYLQIIYECHLPRMIQNLNPVIVLKYKFEDLKNLKIEP
jgi:hypothetical protein